MLHVRGDDEWPDFTYTIGLFENFAHAELIVVGLERDLAHGILNDMRDLIRTGQRFDAGTEASRVLKGYPVTFRTIPESHRVAHFGWAEWFYGDRVYPCLQLVYPDRGGEWPWSEKVSDAFRRLQPLLESAPIPDWAVRAPDA